MTDDCIGQRLTRRHLLRLFGVAAGAGLASSTQTLDALTLQSAAGRKVTFPAGSVIRTILSDMQPASIAGLYFAVFQTWSAPLTGVMV